MRSLVTKKYVLTLKVLWRISDIIIYYKSKNIFIKKKSEITNSYYKEWKIRYSTVDFGRNCITDQYQY